MRKLNPTASKTELVNAINSLIEDANHNRVTVGAGLNMQQTPGGKVVSLFMQKSPAVLPTETVESQPIIFARVASYRTLTARTNYAWEYVMDKVIVRNPLLFATMNISSWRDMATWLAGNDQTDESRRASGFRFDAYNLCEDMNNDSISTVVNVLGNGVDISDTGSVPETMTIQPCPIGNVVMCVQSGDSWWFQYENAIDGACS